MLKDKLNKLIQFITRKEVAVQIMAAMLTLVQFTVLYILLYG